MGSTSADTSSAIPYENQAPDFITSLNPPQLTAVKYVPNIPIQILAGPGSGKTKVLTSRIAYLILTHSIQPSSICAVTFTNKAANEMRDRLAKLIGKQKMSEVKMGTFHALCALFLRKHGKLVGLDPNFTICDTDESKKILSTLMKTYKEYLNDKDITLKDGTLLSIISGAKAKGQSAADYLAQVRIKALNAKKIGSTMLPPTDIDHVVGEIYEKYEQTLRRNNSLDFDDLLLFGVKLFTEHKQTVEWCHHVLVDEFQDTNITQYQLMKELAINGCITVVGDPDQSIYGWRSAEIGNLAKMREDFVGTEVILLEQNYRSTASILNASLTIVAQDSARIQKSLHTDHPPGIPPVLCSFPTEHDEANFVAVEIKRLTAQMGGVLRWGDFVVLLRFSALSRAIENALQKEGIPSRILGGHKFFERLEIKNILAYLQLVDNPNFNPACVRAVNVPSRGIGDKTLLEISLRAEKAKIPQLHIIEGIYDGRLPDIKPPIKRKIVPFVKAIRRLRDLAEKRVSPADLIRHTLELVGYEDHLKKTQPDWESRWENVQELITFASEVEADIANVSSTDPGEEASMDTPLRSFLQASMLSSEGDNHSEEDSKEKVTISTCHAAKGLEWPVVMIPAVEQGTFPFYRADNIEEERRLLYVACTRAQGLLYLTHAAKRKVAGDTKTKKLSEFVSAVADGNSTLFTTRTPSFLPADRAIISSVLNRVIPDTSEVSRLVAEFERTARHHTSGDEARRTETPQHPTPLGRQPRTSMDLPATFASAKMNSDGMPSFDLIKTSFSSTNILSPRPAPCHAMQLPTDTSPSDGSVQPVIMKLDTARPTVQASQITNATSRGTKRHLGMGRNTVAYSNKKFKPPT